MIAPVIRRDFLLPPFDIVEQNNFARMVVGLFLTNFEFFYGTGSLVSGEKPNLDYGKNENEKYEPSLPYNLERPSL